MTRTILLVVILLLVLEFGGEIVAELDYLLEARLATAERHLDQVHTRILSAAVVLQGLERLTHGGLLCDLELQEAAGASMVSVFFAFSSFLKLVALAIAMSKSAIAWVNIATSSMSLATAHWWTTRCHTIPCAQTLQLPPPSTW